VPLIVSLILQRFALVFLVAVSLALATAAPAHAGPWYPPARRDDLSAQENSNCPPVDEDGKLWGLAEDANVAGHKNGKGQVDPKLTDAYMGKWHWDDGKGNDLTVEKWCIRSTVWYFSQRIIVSKKKKLTVVAAPKGYVPPNMEKQKGGAIDPGYC
jgi:hypothetical protein